MQHQISGKCLLPLAFIIRGVLENSLHWHHTTGPSRFRFVFHYQFSKLSISQSYGNEATNAFQTVNHFEDLFRRQVHSIKERPLKYLLTVTCVHIDLPVKILHNILLARALAKRKEFLRPQPFISFGAVSLGHLTRAMLSCGLDLVHRKT